MKEEAALEKMRAPTEDRCRQCGSVDVCDVIDLGMSPLANAFVAPGNRMDMEPFYPLRAFLCSTCMLVQLPAVTTSDDIFSEYVYFSSYSSSWVDHARIYAQQQIEMRRLGPHSRVIEIASNDGYLLQFFRAAGIPVLGVEPARNVAEVARSIEIPTVNEFFGATLAKDLLASGSHADLMVANNVLAHVPDVHDFVSGFSILLAPDGVASFEFPHLLRLIEQTQFDTIYHEHFSYLSLHSIAALVERHGLSVFDVEELPTHGGSLRVWVRHAASVGIPSTRVQSLLDLERHHGLDQPHTYEAFRRRVLDIKAQLIRFLLDAVAGGKRVVGYGAAAKGNTLLNFCGIRTDLIPCIADRNPHKQGLLSPGTHIPIVEPQVIEALTPDFVLVLPWNLLDEVRQQIGFVSDWGGRLVTAVPKLRVH